MRGKEKSNGVLKFNLENRFPRSLWGVCEEKGSRRPSPQPCCCGTAGASPGHRWDLLAGVGMAISLSPHKKPSAPLSFPNCCIYHQPFSACSPPHSARMCQNRDIPAGPPAVDTVWWHQHCLVAPAAPLASQQKVPHHRFDVTCVSLAQITAARPRWPGVRPFALRLDKQPNGGK